MNTIIFSTNLNKQSKTTVVANALQTLTTTPQHTSTHHCLADLELPMCDGYHCYSDQTVIDLQTQLKNAQGIIICAPIYNYDLNAVAKNLIELTGQEWHHKVVSIAVTAGGEKSYMAPLSFINSLMIDYRCHVMPKYVYVTPDAFDDTNALKEGPFMDRIKECASQHIDTIQRLK